MHQKNTQPLFKMGIEITLGAFFVVLWKRMEWDEEEAQFSLFSLCIVLLFKHIERWRIKGLFGAKIDGFNYLFLLIFFYLCNTYNKYRKVVFIRTIMLELLTINEQTEYEKISKSTRFDL